MQTSQGVVGTLTTAAYVMFGAMVAIVAGFAFARWRRAKREERQAMYVAAWREAEESHPGLYTKQVAAEQAKLDRMRGVTLCVSHLSPSAGYAWWLMRAFWRRLGKVELVFALRSEIPDEVAAIGPVHFARMNSWEGARLIRRLNVRHIYLTDWPGFSVWYGVWRMLGVRTILAHDHVPGDHPRASGIRGEMKALVHRLRLFSPSRCIAVAEHVRQRHIHYWRVPSDKCVVVQNGIEPFEPSRGRRVEIRAELGIPEGAKTFAMVCRATAYKGIAFAIEVLAKAPGVHIIHCGDGQDLGDFKAMAREYGVADRMHFLGLRSDVKDILGACDGAFHPSQGEAMSLAILEYMCAGLPVVVPNIRSVRCALDEGVTGLTYVPGHVASALQAIHTVTPVMGQRAREAVLSRYNFTRTMAEFEQHVVSAIRA